ncbi:MAG: hypothetical protein ACPGKS_08815, partial [Coraliomargarita sp.]
MELDIDVGSRSSVEPSATLVDVALGQAHFDEPGLKIIRFVTGQKLKRVVKFDRLRLLRDDDAQVAE